MSKTSIASDDRGGTYVEFLIVILPVLTLALGVLQLSQLYAAKMSLDHAAVNAARSATVVMSDDPKYYGGEPVNTEGTKRTEAVRTAAARSMAPFVLDGSIQSADVKFPNGIPRQKGEDLTVEVHSRYRCGVPLVYRIVCDSNGFRNIVGRATIASNAASFTY